jgi:molybdate transport system substrate-binding protein
MDVKQIGSISKQRNHLVSELYILSGGAAQGIVTKLEAAFKQETGHTIHGRFGAVGLMKEHLLQGDKCDVLILSQTLIDGLIESGHARAGSARSLGVVKTGVAVKTGEPTPKVDTPNDLKAALCQASAIYFPDPEKATAGIHFMSVLRRLGIESEVSHALRPFPNGATAMREMAQSKESGAIGCTQISEILFTPGVQLVAPLPTEFSLATPYIAAVSSTALDPSGAEQLISFLAHPNTLEARKASGLE